MKKFGLNEAERYIKRCLKGKIGISKALVISFLITGVFSFDAYALLVKKNIIADNPTVKDNTYIGREGVKIGGRSVVLSEGDRAGIKSREIDLNIQDPEKRFKEVNYGYGHFTITNGKKPEERFANTTESVVIGHRAAAYTANVGLTASNAVAVGHMAVAATNALALGDNTVALDSGSIALGKDTFVSKAKSISIGYKAYNESDNSVGIGAFHVIKGDNSIAMGYDSLLESNHSVAIGNGSRVSKDKEYSVAIGSGSVTTADLSKAGHDFSTGKPSVKTDTTWQPNHGEFAVGNGSTYTRRITGVAAGEKDTDAVNVAQLKNAIETVNTGGGNTAIDLEIKAKDDNSTALSVDQEDKSKHHYKIGLNETTLITNLSNGANIDSNTHTSPKLITDEILKKYLHNENIPGMTKEENGYYKYNNIVFANDQSPDTKSKYTLKFGDRFNFLGSDSIDVKTENGSSNVGSGFKFELKQNGVKTSHINSGAVTNDKIQNNTIDESKLNQNLKNKINGKVDSTDINVTKKNGSIEALTVEKTPNKKHFYEIGLNETTLITNLSNGANIATGAGNKLVTDKQIYDYIEPKKIIFDALDKDGNLAKAENNNNNATYTFNLKEFGNNDKNKLHFKSGNTINVIGLVDKSGFKFEVADNSITSGKIADNAVTEKKLATDSVTTDKIKNGNVTSEKLAKDSVTTNKIKNESVTEDKLANELKTKINGKVDTTTFDEFKGKGITFVGDNQSKTNAIKLGYELTIKDEKNNIKFDASGNEIKVSLNSTLNGISNINNDPNNGITFKTGDANETTATVKVGGTDLTLKKVKEKVKEAAPNGGQPTETDKSFIKISNVATPTEDFDAANKKYVDDSVKSLTDKFGNSKLKYKASKTNGTISGKQEEVTLDSGLDFKSTDNITTEVAADGVVKHKLNSALTKIYSIENEKQNAKIDLADDGIKLSTGKDKVVTVKDNAITGVKTLGEDSDNNISFKKAKDGNPTTAKIKVDGKELTITKDNEKLKISGLADGEISDNSAEVINGKQLNELAATHLGLTVKNKTGFNAPTFKALKDEKGTDETVAKTFKAAIDTNIEAINRGFKVVGDQIKDDKSKDKTQYLGSTTSIKAGDFTEKNQDGTATTTKAKEYKGKNLKTEYSYEDGNGTVIIGMTENPEFKSVEFKNGDGTKGGTISADASGNITVKHEGDNKESKIATKDMLDDLTISYKNNGKGSEAEGQEVKPFTRKLTEGFNFADGSNITAKADANGDVKFNLNSNLSEIDSIGADDSLKIEFKKDKGIKLVSKGKTISVKGNEISGVKKIGTDKNNISFDNTVGSDKVTKLTVDGNSLDFKKSTTENEKDKVLISNVATPQADYDAVNKKYVDGKIKETKANIDELNDNVPVEYTDKDGKKLVKKGNKFYTTDDKGQATKVEVPKDQVFVSLKEKTQLKNLKSGLGIDDIKTHSDSEKQGKNIEKVKDLTEGKLDTELNNAANIGDLKALAIAGMYFKGNTGEVHRNLGQTLIIKGDQREANNTVDSKTKAFVSAKDNINVRADKDTNALVVELAEELKNLKTAVFNGEVGRGNNVKNKVDTTISGDGTRIKEYIDVNGHPTIAKETTYTIDNANFKDKEIKGDKEYTKETNVSVAGTVVTDTEEGKTSSLEADGLKISEVDDNGDEKPNGKSAHYGLDKITLESKEAGKESKTEITNSAIIIKGKDDKEEVSLTKNGLKFKKDDGTDGININANESKISGTKTIGADDKNNISFDNPVGHDKVTKLTVDGNSLDFKKSTTENEKDKVLISNVATPQADYDAVNKKYVDGKIKETKANIDELNDNVPVEYTDKDGNKLVKKGNKFYTTENEVFNDDVYVSVKKVDKQKSGLNLDKETNVDYMKAKDIIAKLNDAKAGDNNLNYVATVRDLQAVSKAGLDFVGNDPNTSLHRNLGEKVVIKGADLNINVEATEKGLDIELAKRLRDLEEAVFVKENADGTKVKTTVDGTGTEIKEVDKDGNPKVGGKSAEYKLDGSKLADGKGNTTETKANGMTVVEQIEKDGAKTKKEATYNADGITIKNGDNKVVEIKNKNGKGEINFASEGEGKDKKGTGKITGLEDISDDETDGTIAANKNYVDKKTQKISDKVDNMNDNVPVEYTDKDGHKLVKKGNKFYTTNTDGTASENLYTGDVYVSVKKVEKQKSGLSLDKETNITPEKAIETIKKLNDARSEDNNLNYVATVRDLQAVSKAGLNFTGNDTTNELHKNLGETLTIKGAGTIAKDFSSADGNINVRVNGNVLDIELSKRLANLEKAVFEKEIIDKETGSKIKIKTTVDGTGTEIKEFNTDGTVKQGGESAEYKLDGSKVADGKGNTTETKANGMTVVEETEKDGVKTKKEATYNADGITVKNGDNKVVEIKNKDGKGKINFAKDNDNKGTGKITGLADISYFDSGDTAVNKNYIDKNVKNINDKIDTVKYNVPVVYTNKLGDKLLKHKDKFYMTDKYGNATRSEEPSNEIYISLRDKTQLNNLKSGLGIDDLKGKTESEKQSLSGEIVTNLRDGKLDDKLSNAANIRDLKALTTAGLDFEGNDEDKLHKNLGDKLSIKGAGITADDSKNFAGSKGNINVKKVNDGLEVELSSKLKNLKSAEFKNGEITGLADLNEKSDGSSAANKNYVDSRVGAMETKFTDELGDASALNAALAGLKPLAYDPIRKSQFAAAMGYYKGKTAFALGLNHYTSENTLINGGVSFASGSNVNNRRGIMLNLGITHKFGTKKDIESLPTQYQEGPITALYVLQQELQKVIAENSKLKITVQTQAKENAEIIQKLEKQEKENAELKARMDKQEEQIQMLLERIK